LKVLGLDPAKKTGWAYYDDFWVVGKLNPYDTKAVMRCLGELWHLGVDHAFIEDCYLGGVGRNVATLKALVRCQTRLVMALEHYEIPHTLIVPTVWQGYFKVRGKRPERKQRAIEIAEPITGFKLTSDEADAVLIAEFGRVHHEEGK